MRHLEVYGLYNVGFLSFRRDDDGLRCLQWWRDRCIEWCYCRIEDGRYADQRYLDDWPTRFRNVTVLQHKGANLAPWGLAQYQVATYGDQVRVDEQSLMFFHFHGLRRVRSWLFDLNPAKYKVRPNRSVIRHIFAPYVQGLLNAERRFPSLLHDETRTNTIPHERENLEQLVRRMGKTIFFPGHVVRRLLQRSYVIVFNDRIV